MSTKAKIVISISGIAFIIAVIVLSLVLAFTSPTIDVESSTLVIDYSAGDIKAKVNVSREDVNSYYSEDDGQSTMDDIEELATYLTSSSSSKVTSDEIDLGKFNNGQYIDITEADTTLIIEVILLNNSDSFKVSLNYTDLYDKDSNVKLVVNASLYTSNNTEMKLDNKVCVLQNGNWDSTNLVDSSISLSNYGYTKMIIEVEAKVVSYAEESVKLDGRFNLTLSR